MSGGKADHTDSTAKSQPGETDDAVYIAALHVGIPANTTKALLATLQACGLAVVQADRIEQLERAVLANCPRMCMDFCNAYVSQERQDG
jgi:hypothetical protein